MQLRTKREDGDRDRFVEYLKTTEGIEYTTIAMDVKTRSGNKDFDYHMHYFSEVIARLIPKKNQQLDYEAERNVLLICNACYMARFVEIAQAITDFVSASAGDLSNIDEIYVEYEMGKFERLYAAS